MTRTYFVEFDSDSNIINMGVTYPDAPYASREGVTRVFVDKLPVNTPLANSSNLLEQAVSSEIGWHIVRDQRARLISETAWIRERAFDQGLPVPQEWLDYWQALRDIPQTFENPKDVIWPEQPTV